MSEDGMVVIFPYGLSLHLETISTSKQQTTLSRFFPTSAFSIFDGPQSWVVKEVPNLEDNTESLILANQKRLQEHSGSKSVTSVDSTNISKIVPSLSSSSNEMISEEMISLSMDFLNQIEKPVTVSDTLFQMFLSVPGTSVSLNITSSINHPITLTDELIFSPSSSSSSGAGLVDKDVDIKSSEHQRMMVLESTSLAIGDDDTMIQQLQEEDISGTNKYAAVRQVQTLFTSHTTKATNKIAASSTTATSVVAAAAVTDSASNIMEKRMESDINEMDNIMSSLESELPSASTDTITAESEKIGLGGDNENDGVDVIHHVTLDQSETAAATGTHVLQQQLQQQQQVSMEEESIDALLSESNTANTLRLFKAAVDTNSTSASASSSSWASKEKLPMSEYDTLRPRLALDFPFELDDFQRQAVMRLERRECVFVAAHTSAGKTVIAEYAIALAKQHMTRAIYTSPIKALSNQKFRDLRERFGADNVGLITGDTSVNPTAGCLVMTTEILRSMLYRGSDTVRDIEFVIFDEVHYVNDAERGVVWEEVIIMLPERVHLVFLSATTPNVFEFSDWIGRTKRRKVYVIDTLKRPVPLQHFLLFRDDVTPLTLNNAGAGKFRSGVIGEVTARMKERDKPKTPSTENMMMKLGRQQEKLAVASMRAGKSITAVATATGGGGRGRGGSSGSSGSSGNSRAGGLASGGSKAQWVQLVNLLKAGGREASGGVTAVDFGTGYNERVLSVAARREKDTFVPYEKLPADMRKVVSKQEYAALLVRGSEDESEQVSSSGTSDSAAGATVGGLLPAIVFCFSKKKCEDIADNLKGLNLITQKEKAEVRRVMGMAVARLSALDAQLPQVKKITEMLGRGIGVHHGGLLPVLKECVELLFAQSVVRVLIATETFAMGVNMPARCVVFSGYRKHDGKSFRDLLPGEYTQMAGRAGRRGKDKVGTVIVTVWGDQLPAEASLAKLLTGTATKLSSKFRLTYSMILNLLRSGDLSVEEMIKRSFSEFHTQKALQSNNIGNKLKEWKKVALLIQHKIKLETCTHDDGSSDSINCDIEQYVQLHSQCRLLQQSLLQGMLTSTSSSSAATTSTSSSNISTSGQDYISSNVLCAGRVVLCHTSGSSSSNNAAAMASITSPCSAVILTDASATTTTAVNVATVNTTATASSTSINDRTALFRPSPLTAAVGSETVTTTADHQQQHLYVWLLILLPVGISPLNITTTPTVTAPNTATTAAAEATNATAATSITNTTTSTAMSGFKVLKRDDGDDDYGYGVGSKAKGKQQQQPSKQQSSSSTIASSSVSSSSSFAKVAWTNETSASCQVLGSDRAFAVLRVPMSDIVLVTNKKITTLPVSTATSDVAVTLQELASLTFSPLEPLTHTSGSIGGSSGYVNLDAADMRNQLIITVKNINTLSLSCQTCHQLSSRYNLADKRRILIEKVLHWESLISNDNLSLFPDFQQRMSLLVKLGYLEPAATAGTSSDTITETDTSSSSSGILGHVVTLKGRVACEMNTCGELLAAEMIFDNILEPLNPPEAVALLSALICKEKGDSGSSGEQLTTRLEIARTQCMAIEAALESLSLSAGLPASSSENDSGGGGGGDDGRSNKLNFGLAAVVYQWARGVPFRDITDMTLVQEGSIVRTITRLDELCRDFRNAARVVGNPSLFRKMEAASLCIKRDIVFAASMYIN